MVAGPTVPPPPALLSIAIGWPRIFEALSAIARIEMSVEPPAGHGTISVIGLVGIFLRAGGCRYQHADGGDSDAKMVTSRHVKMLPCSLVDGRRVVFFPGLNLPRNRLRRKAY